MNINFAELGTWSDLIGIGTFLFSALSLLFSFRTRQHLKREQARLSEVVKLMIIVTDGVERVTLPITVRRAEVSRAEILGRLGMVPMRTKGARFALAFVSTMEFCEAVSAIAAGRATTLVIPASQSELAQFDI